MPKYYDLIVNSNGAEQEVSTLPIEKYSTKELVEELLKREGVDYKKVEPYADEVISANGPAILIKVID